MSYSRLDILHDQYVLVPADKAENNSVIVCKTHYINGILEELGFNFAKPLSLHQNLRLLYTLYNHSPR